jgi:hypothetical protein
VKLLRPTHPYVAIAVGFAYVAVILDAWSRRVIGYAIIVSIPAAIAPPIAHCTLSPSVARGPTKGPSSMSLARLSQSATVRRPAHPAGGQISGMILAAKGQTPGEWKMPLREWSRQKRSSQSCSRTTCLDTKFRTLSLRPEPTQGALITAGRLHSHERQRGPRNPSRKRLRRIGDSIDPRRLRLANVDPRLETSAPTRISPPCLHSTPGKPEKTSPSRCMRASRPRLPFTRQTAAPTVRDGHDLCDQFMIGGPAGVRILKIALTMRSARPSPRPPSRDATSTAQRPRPSAAQGRRRLVCGSCAGSTIDARLRAGKDEGGVGLAALHHRRKRYQAENY